MGPSSTRTLAPDTFKKFVAFGDVDAVESFFVEGAPAFGYAWDVHGTWSIRPEEGEVPGCVGNTLRLSIWVNK
jgi:hypothetical protein